MEKKMKTTIMGYMSHCPPLIMENQMERKMEEEMETEIIQGIKGYSLSS